VSLQYLGLITTCTQVSYLMTYQLEEYLFFSKYWFFIHSTFVSTGIQLSASKTYNNV